MVSHMLTLDPAIAALSGALLGALIGGLTSYLTERSRFRRQERASLRTEIDEFVKILQNHALARIADIDGEDRTRLEFKANAAANLVAMGLKRSDDAVADLVLGAVVNTAPPEKQYDRSFAVIETLRAWYRGELRSSQVEADFNRRLAESPTAQM